jgi:hypothetical protein
LIILLYQVVGQAVAIQPLTPQPVVVAVVVVI